MSITPERTVDIIYPGKELLSIMLENGNLLLDTLKQYFPLAVGLKYEVDGKVHYFKFEKNVNLLKVHLATRFYELLLSEGEKLIYNMYKIIKMYKILFFLRNLFVLDDIKDKSVSDLIDYYFRSQYTHKEMCKMLEVKHNVQIPLRTLQKILKEKGLKRKSIIESPMEDIFTAITTEINDCGLNLGYRLMWLRLKTRYNLTVKQSTVLSVMNVVDPDGIEKRSRYKLKRRQYKVPGPNHLWHIDGFDKLKKYGFAIHGCVDGFSRRVLWLESSMTNNKPEVIAYYYLNCVQNLKCVPSVIRSDRGTENTIVEILQKALRNYHTDIHAKDKSFIKGKSTANERIEKYWKHMINHTVGFYIQLFKLMSEENILDIGNIVHIQCLRFCFSHLINYDLKVTQCEWNKHRVRKQNIRNIPSDIPNVLYYWPEKVGAKDCKKEIHPDDVNRLINKFTIKPEMYSSKVKDLIEMVMPNCTTPSSAKEAYDLFKKLVQLINLHCTESS